MTRLFPICFLAVLLCNIATAQPPRPVKPASLGPSPKSGGAADDILPPAPPIPEPPAESAVRPTGPAPLDIKPLGPSAGVDDPAAVRAPSAGTVNQASEEFAKKHYAQAATLFTDADRRHEQFTPVQRDEWGYCRLYSVAVKLNRGPDGTIDLAQLNREVEEAQRSGSEKLVSFAKQLRDEIRRRNPGLATPVGDGWQSYETASFRIMFQSRREFALEVGQVAEAARVAMYERWLGPPGSNWSPRCDIYLHAGAADYAKATGKTAEQSGHSTVETKGDRVTSRRIDLRLDDPILLDCTLPSEITQVILAEVFADEPLPRWAVVGMAALSESPASVARYRRAIPGLLKEGKLFAVGPFVDSPRFPKPESVTAFYAQSVSLISYLVELRGPKAFAEFLREGPRRGYAKALTTHYGFKDPADLQDRWLRHAMGQ
jgi:hypothetical protein